MAKIRGNVSALYIQTTAVSTQVTGASLTRVGTTLWYIVASVANVGWDKAKAITVYDGGSPITPLEYDYASGAVRLSAAASGAVTATFYKFAFSQFGGFRSFTIDEAMELIECTCFEDEGEVYEPGAYSSTGSGEGFWSSVDSSLDLNGLTLLARPLGAAGDAVAAECVVSGNNTPLSVPVTGQAISIVSATGPGGAATSTLREIRDAIEANPYAAALVKCKYTAGHDGSEVMGAISHTHLSGGVLPEMLARFGEDILAVFYWDSGANLYRTVGLITFEKQSVKTGVKGLVGKTLSWKSQGMLYDHSA